MKELKNREEAGRRTLAALEAHAETFRQALKRLAQGGVLAAFGQHRLDCSLSLADIER